MRSRITEGYEVSRLAVFSLGGYPQKVLLEGKSRRNPVVITLHGGPGTPIPFSVGCRGLFPAFTERFTMVYWDQLGCGINNHPIDDSFTIDSFVQMTRDLVQQVKGEFPGCKVLLFATSWGSILSAKLLEADPQAVDAVVACGQIVKNVFFAPEVLEALSQSAIPTRQLEQIRRVTPDNFQGRDLQRISSALRKYTNAYQNRQGPAAPLGPIVKGLLTSPDYRLRDFLAIAVNGYRKNTSLWQQILPLDLSQTLRQVQIPYWIYQGDTDLVASTKTAGDLADSGANPNLHCQVVANTGHLPGAAMMDAIFSGLEALAEK